MLSESYLELLLIVFTKLIGCKNIYQTKVCEKSALKFSVFNTTTYLLAFSEAQHIRWPVSFTTTSTNKIKIEMIIKSKLTTETTRVWSQFHQHFTRSFYAHSSQKCKKRQIDYIFCALVIFNHKIWP